MPVEDTIKGFKAIIDGEMDEYPENAFSMSEQSRTSRKSKDYAAVKA